MGARKVDLTVIHFQKFNIIKNLFRGFEYLKGFFSNFRFSAKPTIGERLDAK
jgi:hypothetical protein